MKMKIRNHGANSKNDNRQAHIISGDDDGSGCCGGGGAGAGCCPLLFVGVPQSFT